MLRNLSGRAACLAPWMVIGSLAYAAVFIKPTVNPVPLEQPLVEQRDAFFDGAVLGDRLWVVGQNGALLSSLDEGAHWTREEVPTRGNLQAMAVSDQGRIVIAGNQGRLWTRQASGPWESRDLMVSELAGKLLSVSFINGHFWVVGAMGAVFRGDENATNWKAMREREDVTLNSVRAGADGDLWITAEFGLLLRSRDGGATWSTQELGSESLRAIAFEGHEGVAVGNQGQAFLTEDAGDTWRPLERFTREHLFDVVFHRGEWLTTGDRGALFRSRSPASGWQAWAPKGLDKGYHNRLLDTADGVVLIGHQLGLLSQDELQLWPREQEQ
jgi:photosystem II stability/assembly factor-like uncharacterized protein